MKKLLTAAAFAFAVFTVMGFTGNADMENAQQERANYCDMVKSGAWPDYQGNASECADTVR